MPILRILFFLFPQVRVLKITKYTITKPLPCLAWLCLAQPGTARPLLAQSGPSWHSLPLPGTALPLLAHPDPFWHSLALLAQSDTTWPLLVQSDTAWPLLAQPGTVWPLLAQSDTVWPLLAQPGPSWHSLAHPGTGWHNLAQPTKLPACTVLLKLKNLCCCWFNLPLVQWYNVRFLSCRQSGFDSWAWTKYVCILPAWCMLYFLSHTSLQFYDNNNTGISL